MKKQILRGISALMLCFTAIGVAAQAPQEVPALPLDTAIVTGVLDNGLTYYIRHNENPKGQADFYIAQKVGSILEDDNQRGLAHFLEHMCFNGTENFPEKGIINWLESVGVKFGENLNAYTSIDETVYNISSVPVARKSVQDSCLLILHDWSCALTLDPKEIDSERGVIHEEWRRSNVGQMRILESLLPVMYPDNKYGERLPIGTMEVVDNFPPQAIIDYYHKWYRPDQQGIIVVGDIDPNYIEAKIKEIFSPIKMPENAAERTYLEVEDTPGTIYAIGKDAEMQYPVIQLSFKSDDILLPTEMRNSQFYFPITYMQRMISAMLNNRTNELTNKPETEFANAGISFGEYMVSKTKGALDLSVVAKDTDVIPAFQQAYRELLRAARGGFTVGEYERARAEFLSSMEKAYENRNDRETDSYSREIVRYFVDNEPMPGIELEKQIYDQIAQVLTVDQINQYLPQIITDDNRVLLAMLPDKEGFSVPTEEELAKAIADVDAETLEPYKDEMREDPLIPSLPKPGKIAKTQHNKTWDATEYILGNGMKVIVKPTDFKNNEIILQGIALGNAMASHKDIDGATLRYFPMAISNEALYDYSNSDIAKYMQGKQAGVGFGFDAYTRTISGNTTVKDLPTLMELIYAYFTGFGLKEDEFTANRDALAGILANQESNPQFIFQKDLMKILYKAEANQLISSADVKAANREEIVKLFKDMTANAADYTLYFVGNIDEATFVPLMKQYLATIPGNPKKATTKYTTDPDFEFNAANEQNNFTTKMETPQSWIFVGVLGNTSYTVKNRLITDVAEQVLSKRLLTKIREEMGATYSIGANGMLSRTASKYNTFFQVACPVNPDKRDEVIKEIKNIIDESTKTITADEIKPAIEFLAKENEKELKENSDLASHMLATHLNGVNVYKERGAIIPTITVAEVQDYLKHLVDQNLIRIVVLNPEETK
mgnify:CR=1 FL=1